LSCRCFLSLPKRKIYLSYPIHRRKRSNLPNRPPLITTAVVKVHLAARPRSMIHTYSIFHCHLIAAIVELAQWLTGLGCTLQQRYSLQDCDTRLKQVPPTFRSACRRRQDSCRGKMDRAVHDWFGQVVIHEIIRSNILCQSSRNDTKFSKKISCQSRQRKTRQRSEFLIFKKVKT
jgi:hypothetical protein